MSRLFNDHYIGNEEQYGYGQGYQQRKMDEEWQWFEQEKANDFMPEPDQIFVFEDGLTIICPCSQRTV